MRNHHIEPTVRVVSDTLLMNVVIVAMAFVYPMAALVLVTTAWLFYLFAGSFWTSIA